MPTKGRFIGKDIPWAETDGQMFRVEYFLRFAFMERGKVKDISKFMPYAVLRVYCPEFFIPGEELYMPVVNKHDFAHLWELYIDRGVSSNEEVWVHYFPSDKAPFKFMPQTFAHLVIEVHPKGSFEIAKQFLEKSKPNQKDWNDMLDRTAEIAHWEPIEDRTK
ncbi:MAG: hypothetical protein Q7T57_01810 [Dehalococcoidales bacterium]|nr:hypothetical protein [Dehalococcoidales bacterium]